MALSGLQQPPLRPASWRLTVETLLQWKRCLSPASSCPGQCLGPLLWHAIIFACTGRNGVISAVPDGAQFASAGARGVSIFSNSAAGDLLLQGKTHLC